MASASNKISKMGSSVEMNSRLSAVKQLRPAFTDLAANDIDKQTHGSVQIMQYVETRTQQRTSVGKDKSDDVEYIVNRLVNGLSAPREVSRQGYFTALQGMLKLTPTTTLIVLTAIKKMAEAAKKGDKRNIDIGEILGYGAIVKAGCLQEVPEERSSIINRLISIRGTKSYMEILSTQFLVLLVDLVGKDVLQSDIVPRIREELGKPVLDLSPCELWLRLALSRHKVAPTVMKADQYSEIYQVLLKNCASLPLAHPMLPEVVTHFKPSNRHLLDFWKLTVGPESKQASRSTLMIIFQLTEHVLPRVSSVDEMEEVLNDDFLRQLINTGYRSDSAMTAAAQRIASALANMISLHKDDKTGELQTATLKRLMRRPGTVRIDQLTRTRLMHLATLQLGTAAVKNFASMLQEIISSSSDDGVKANQKYAAQLLAQLVGHSAVASKEELQWRAEQILFLLQWAVFSSEVPKDLQLAYTEALMRAMDTSVQKLQDYCQMLHIVVDGANIQLEKGTVVIAQEARGVWATAVEKLKELDEKSDSTDQSYIFKVLFSHLGLQLFIEPASTSELIEDLLACQKNAAKATKKKKKKQEKGLETEDDLNWVEVVTDLLLSFLSKPTHMWRSVAQAVFKLLCPQLTSRAMSTITDVINPEAEEDTLMNKSNKKSEENDDEQTKEESDNSEGEEEESGDEDGEENDDDEEEDDEMDPDKLDAIKMKMRSILGGDHEDVEMDDADPEELSKLDKQLGSILKPYMSDRSKRRRFKKHLLSRNDTALMHFRTRVCDLLEVYTKSESCEMSLLLQSLPPLLAAYSNAAKDIKFMPLQNRLKSILKHICSIRKFSKINESTHTVEVAVNAMDAIADRESSADVAGWCYAQAARAALHALGDAASEVSPNAITDAVCKHMETFFNVRKSNMPMNLLSCVLALESKCLWLTSKVLHLHAFSDSTRLFRRHQALDLLTVVFKNQAIVGTIKEKKRGHFLKKVNQDVVQVLNSATKASEVKKQHTCSLFSLMVAVAQMEKKLSEDSTLDAAVWQEVSDALTAWRLRLSISTDLRREFKKLASALGINANLSAQREGGQKKQQKKEKLEANAGDESTKKKKKPKSQARIIADSAKVRRLDMDVGELASFSFVSQVALPDAEMPDVEDVEEIEVSPVQEKRKSSDKSEEPKKKKKKKKFDVNL